MNQLERELVIAVLRCAAASDLHSVMRDLSATGRLMNETWARFYAADCDAAAAVRATESETA